MSEATATAERPVPRLKVRYNDQLRGQLKDTLGVGNRSW